MIILIIHLCRLCTESGDSHIECSRGDSHWGGTARIVDQHFLCSASLPPIGLLRFTTPSSDSDTLKQSISSSVFDYNLSEEHLYLQFVIAWSHSNSIELSAEMQLKHLFEQSQLVMSRPRQTLICDRYHLNKIQVSDFNLAFWIVASIASLFVFTTLLTVTTLYLYHTKTYSITSRL
jgi:hypothetical protein